MAEHIKYDSDEERWFAYYLEELMAHGYLADVIYQPSTFELSPETCVRASVMKRNKKVDKYINLAREVSYTADFKLFWNIEAHGVFYWREEGCYKNNFFPYRKSSHDNFIPFFANNRISYVDVKGGFAGRSNTSAITFPVKQKWLISKGIYVQKVVVSLTDKGLFARTFTPDLVAKEAVYKVKYGDKKVGDSKLKYKSITINDYVYNKER